MGSSREMKKMRIGAAGLTLALLALSGTTASGSGLPSTQPALELEIDVPGTSRMVASSDGSFVAYEPSLASGVAAMTRMEVRSSLGASLAGYRPVSFLGRTADLLVAATSEDGAGSSYVSSLAIWAADGVLVALPVELSPSRRLTSVIPSEDGRLLVLSIALPTPVAIFDEGAGRLELFDIASGAIRVLTAGPYDRVLSFSTDGATLRYRSAVTGEWRLDIGSGVSELARPLGDLGVDVSINRLPSGRYERRWMPNVSRPSPRDPATSRDALFDPVQDLLVELPIELVGPTNRGHRALSIIDAAADRVLLSTSGSPYRVGVFDLVSRRYVEFDEPLEGASLTAGGTHVVARVASTGAPSTSVLRKVPLPLPRGMITSVDAGTPLGANAVLANLTMVDGVSSGYVTADKCTSLRPGSQPRSNGNHAGGDAVANLSVVPVDEGGRFCLFNQQQVNLVVDVQGSFGPVGEDGLEFTAIDPRRILDSRVMEPVVPAGSTTRVSTPLPPGSRAVLVNLTMVDGTSAGYVNADLCDVLDSEPQSKSSGNHGVDRAIANLAVVPVGADGTFCIFNQRPVHLVVDLQGVFTPPSSDSTRFEAVDGMRIEDTRLDGDSVAPGTITRVRTGRIGASAALVNLTMVDGESQGYVTADRCSSIAPGVQRQSSGNHDAADAIANLAVVPLDVDGSFCVYNQVAVNLVVDLQGVFSDSAQLQFFPSHGGRRLDTR